MKSVNLVKSDLFHCTSSKKSYVSVTDSMTFSSLSLSHSPATNFVGQARESDQRRSVVPSRSCCKTLSAIANQIAGSRWNGFLFFGLKKRDDAASEESAA